VWQISWQNKTEYAGKAGRAGRQIMPELWPDHEQMKRGKINGP